MGLSVGPNVAAPCFVTGKPQLTKSEAKSECKRRVRYARRSSGGMRLDAYRCRHCDSWHIGRRP